LAQISCAPRNNCSRLGYLEGLLSTPECRILRSYGIAHRMPLELRSEGIVATSTVNLRKDSQRKEQGQVPCLGNQHDLLSRMGRLELMVRKAGVR